MEKTRLVEQYFWAVQKFVVLELGLMLLPVGGQTEASQLVLQMVTSLFVELGCCPALLCLPESAKSKFFFLQKSWVKLWG